MKNILIVIVAIIAFIFMFHSCADNKNIEVATPEEIVNTDSSEETKTIDDPDLIEENNLIESSDANQNQIKDDDLQLKYTRESYFAIAMLYYNYGDYANSFNYMKKASDKGYIEADYVLATFYFNGIGTSIDYSKAFTLFKKSAERDNIKAQAIIADMYFLGRGTLKDDTQAAKWLIISAQKGNADALKILNHLN